LSNAALTSGLEWNVKVTEKDSFDIITKFNATFETYWNDEEFTSYTGSEQDEQKLKIALKKEDFNNEGDDNYFTFDIRPYYYQKEILEQLQAERKLFNRYKNLIVAATGMGKTIDILSF